MRSAAYTFLLEPGGHLFGMAFDKGGEILSNREIFQDPWGKSSYKVPMFPSKLS